MTKAERLGLRAAAAAITLLSGAVMVLAGYLGDTERWATAGLITIPGGILILAALALARKADRAVGSAAAHPTPRVAALTLASGGVMVMAGYAASAWGWGLTLLLATIGGLVIGMAFALDRHDGRLGHHTATGAPSRHRT